MWLIKNYYNNRFLIGDIGDASDCLTLGDKNNVLLELSNSRQSIHTLYASMFVDT